VLRILENGMRIMIPINKVGSVGLREIISEEDVKQVYSILREKDISVDSTTWNRRYREYMEKIKTGSVFEIAEVLRDLYLLKGDKDLSFGERKMLDTARSLLIKELAIAKDCDEQDVEMDLKKIFNCGPAAPAPRRGGQAQSAVRTLVRAAVAFPGQDGGIWQAGGHARPWLQPGCQRRRRADEARAGREERDDPRSAGGGHRGSGWVGAASRPRQAVARPRR
jgi:CarD family transcriptional regulator